MPGRFTHISEEWLSSGKRIWFFRMAFTMWLEMACMSVQMEISGKWCAGGSCKYSGVSENIFTRLPKSVRHWNWMKKVRTKWQEIAENLAPYPKGTIRKFGTILHCGKEVDVKLEDLLPQEMLDKEIYYDEGVGGKWSFHFPGNIMHIYPGNAVGLGSDQKELEVAEKYSAYSQPGGEQTG